MAERVGPKRRQPTITVAGDFADAVERLRSIRPHAQRFGGSHAQRDVIDLTLIEAAVRAGDHALADALRRERAFVRH